MNDETPTLPLPPAVLARLRSADTLRAEIAGLTAERDALRAELDTAAWERDTAQNEAAYLRDDVLHRGGFTKVGDDQRVGRILTMGDVPPPAPEHPGDDVALVSLSTGEVYVRAFPNADDSWSRFGVDLSTTDFATLAERGPWVTVCGWHCSYQRHKELADAKRRFRDATYNARPGQAPYPETAADAVERVNELAAKRVTEADPAEWLNAWQMLAGHVRMAWDREAQRNARLISFLAVIPHAPEWDTSRDGQSFCTYCLVAKADHVSTPAVAQ